MQTGVCRKSADYHLTKNKVLLKAAEPQFWLKIWLTSNYWCERKMMVDKVVDNYESKALSKVKMHGEFKYVTRRGCN